MGVALTQTSCFGGKGGVKSRRHYEEKKKNTEEEKIDLEKRGGRPRVKPRRCVMSRKGKGVAFL